MAKPCILVVDDDRVARELLARLLARDFEVITCGDGQEAFQLVQATLPALIVSDYEMPGVTGAELCALIRAQPDPELAGIPLILLTAHGGELHEVESLQAGANDFVEKPVNKAVLKARIDTQLRLHSLRRQLEMQNTELENWRRTHEQDLEAAHVTQQAILPTRLPNISGWQVASHFQPFIQVGGDMYDWQRLGDGSWLFWVSDATGHGASAALLTSLTKLVFRHASTEFARPQEILRAVNSEFYAMLRGKSFMTAACVVLAPNLGSVAFSGAGHPPLIVARRGGEMELLKSDGPPLGIVPEQEFGLSAADLEPEDIALLYTDGLYSARNAAGEFLAPPDLEKLLPQGTATVRDFLQETLKNVLANSQDNLLPDDLAAIALRRV